MGKLYYSLPVDIDNCDQTRARRQHCLFWILDAPIRIVAGKGALVKLNREDIRKLFDTKRSNGHRKALQETLRIFLSLVSDAEQYAVICFIQTPRQLIQSASNC
jgi:hypothetical protein